MIIFGPKIVKSFPNIRAHPRRCATCQWARTNFDGKMWELFSQPFWKNPNKNVSLYDLLPSAAMIEGYLIWIYWSKIITSNRSVQFGKFPASSQKFFPSKHILTKLYNNNSKPHKYGSCQNYVIWHRFLSVGSFLRDEPIFILVQNSPVL